MIRAPFSVIILLLMAAGIACTGRQRPACGDFARAGEWRISAVAPSESLDGAINFAKNPARLVGTMHMKEGWGEPLDYSVDSLSVRADSIRFRFAPAGFLVEGKCTSPTKIQIQYVVGYLSPSDSIAGTGSIARIQ